MHINRSSFPYGTAVLEEVLCDLCGGGDIEEFGRTPDKRLRAVICRRCGLIFMSPRMTREWYRRYYTEEYQRRGRLGVISKAAMASMFERSQSHGRAVAAQLRSQLPPSGLAIDVGSGVGGVLAGFRDVLGLKPRGVEPSPPEARYANAHGIPTENSLIEDIAADGPEFPAADLILSTKSINHYQSPRAFLSWSWHHLKPNGRLLIETKNFRQQVRRSGRIANAIEIDHLYHITPESMRSYLAAAGFRPVYFEEDECLSMREIDSARARGLSGYLIRVIAAKTKSPPFADVGAAIDPEGYQRARASFRPWRTAFHHFFRYRRLREYLRR